MNENNLPHPLAKKIRFSGNCPECEMKGELIEMLLNSMDFFECPKCHLQVTAFPDAVAVLRWRGEGEFRQTTCRATDSFIGQQLFASSEENEILPEKASSLNDYFDLENYITNIAPTYDDWREAIASCENFDFSKQEQHLESIDSEYWETVIEIWKEVEKHGIPSESFHELTEALYNRGVIFEFPWQNWNEGLRNVQNGIVSSDKLKLIEVSKYLTVICRKSRFDNGYESYKHFLTRLFYLLDTIT